MIFLQEALVYQCNHIAYMPSILYEYGIAFYHIYFLTLSVFNSKPLLMKEDLVVGIGIQNQLLALWENFLR